MGGVAMTLEEYMRELILMKKQYGHEEELYPLINMLLRENNNVKALSVRDVHGSRGRVLEHYMLYGYASFPDLVILDEKCDLRSIEDPIDKTNPHYLTKYTRIKDKKEISEKVKKNATWKEIEKKYSKQPKDRDNLSAEEKALINEIYGIVKYQQFSENEKTNIEERLKSQAALMYGCVEAKVKEEEENIKEIPEIKESACFSFDKEKKAFTMDGEELELPCDQLVGELVWYGKVLYTNGLIWKYLEISKKDKKDITNSLLEPCILKRSNWVDCLTTESKFNFNCICVEIGNLSKAYENLVTSVDGDKLANLKNKFESKEKDIDIQKWEQEWFCLKYNLSRIDWKGDGKKDEFDNPYDRFIHNRGYTEE